MSNYASAKLNDPNGPYQIRLRSRNSKRRHPKADVITSQLESQRARANLHIVATHGKRPLLVSRGTNTSDMGEAKILSHPSRISTIDNW